MARKASSDGEAQRIEEVSSQLTSLVRQAVHPLSKKLQAIQVVTRNRGVVEGFLVRGGIHIASDGLSGEIVLESSESKNGNMRKVRQQRVDMLDVISLALAPTARTK